MHGLGEHHHLLLLSSRHPGRAILEAAADAGADLVLVGATPRYVGRRAYFGPTADRILADAPCAVAVHAGGVPPEALRAAVPEAPASHGEEGHHAPGDGGQAPSLH